MFDAVHKETGEPYYAYDVWEEFDDPHEEEWICCPHERNKVTPVKRHPRNYESKEEPVQVRSHFQLKPNEDECNHRGETPIHQKLKILVADLISSEELEFCVDGQKIPINELNFEEVENPEHTWVEKKIQEKRPDVKAKFKNFHPFLGKGIAFEVEWKSTRSKEKREKRTNKFTENGWSVVWIDKEDIEGDKITLKSKVIEVSSVYFRNEVYKKAEERLETKHDEKILKMNNIVDELEDRVSNSVESVVKKEINVENTVRRIKEEINKKLRNPERWMPSETCRTCKYGSSDNKTEGVIACWIDTKYENGYKRMPSKREPFDVCPEYTREGSVGKIKTKVKSGLKIED